MQLSDEEQAMLAGEYGKATQWAIDHQLKVGSFFDAEDMVSVSQAHMMADPESVVKLVLISWSRLQRWWPCCHSHDYRSSRC